MLASAVQRACGVGSGVRVIARGRPVPDAGSGGVHWRRYMVVVGGFGDVVVDGGGAVVVVAVGWGG